MVTNVTSRSIGLLLGGGGAILFSLKGVLMKIAYANGGVLEQMMALRMGMALPFFLAVGIWSHRRSDRSIDARTYLAAAGLGVISYYVCTWLDFKGLEYISAQLGRLILFLYPTITALLAWAFLGDRVTRTHLAALVVSYVGVGVLGLREFGDAGPDAALGAAFVFTAAVLFAGFVTASKSVIAKMGAPLFTSFAMTAAAFFILGHFGLIALADRSMVFTPTLWGIGALLAIPCTVFPSFMVTAAIARIGPGLTSAIGGIGPVATAVFAVALLGEPFGWPHLIALACAIGGVLLLTHQPRPDRASAPHQPAIAVPRREP